MRYFDQAYLKIVTADDLNQLLLVDGEELLALDNVLEVLEDVGLGLDHQVLAGVGLKDKERTICQRR